SRDAGNNQELRRIDEGAEGEPVLLPRGHRLRVPDIAGVKVLEDSEDALRLLLLDLGECDLLVVRDHADGGAGRDSQGDMGKGEGRAGVDDEFGRGVWVEPRGRYGEVIKA